MAWWMRRPVHVSWFIATICVMFVGGVWAAVFVTVPAWAGIFGLFLAVLSCKYSRLFMIIAGCLGGVLFGLGYGTAALGDQGAYAFYRGATVELRGLIREDPSVTSSRQLSLQLSSVSIDHRELPGSVLATVPQGTPVKRGDIIVLQGLLKEGLGSFAATVSRATAVDIIRPEPGDVGRKVRDWFGDQVRTAVKDPQASLGIGFLTGQKSALPEDLSEALRIAGLTHIVVASGYNLTILVRMSRRLFIRISKYLSTLSSSAMIIVFVSITGLSPSMMRAGLVSGLSLLTWYYGRSFHPLVLLPFAAAVTVAIQPSYAWGDLGWQLSFVAFAGVMILAPLLQRYFFGEKEPGLIRQLLGETIAAHIVTTPLIAIYFGTMSHVAIIANLMVVPLVPLAMLLTFVVGVWSATGLPFVWLLATPTQWLLTYMTESATYLAGLSWAQQELVLPWWGWALYCGTVVAACLWMWRVTKYNLRLANPIQ